MKLFSIPVYLVKRCGRATRSSISTSIATGISVLICVDNACFLFVHLKNVYGFQVRTRYHRQKKVPSEGNQAVFLKVLIDLSIVNIMMKVWHSFETTDNQPKQRLG